MLAAGASTRLGEPKQLLQYHGESLLRRSVRTALAAGCRPVIVIVGCEAARMMIEVSDLDATCVQNSQWPSGMASSVRSGLHTLMASDTPPQRALLMVCDQPLISSGLLLELIHKSACEDAEVAACSYAGVLGVPAIFMRRMWPRLLALQGDEGARRVLAACEQVATVQFSSGAIDVDTPDDLIALQASEAT